MEPTLNQEKLIENITKTLKDSSSSINFFSRVLSHEIKNPVSIIYGNLELLKLKYPEISDTKYFNSIVNNLEDITNILDKSCDIIQSIEMNKEPFDIIALIKKIYCNFYSIAKNNNIEYTHNFNDYNNFIIHGDESKIQQILSNILKNAFDACSAGDYIHINFSIENNDMIRMSIKDSGCGMSEELVKSILIPFVTTKTNGTGLGIPIVNYMIQCSGGNLDIQSKLNEGTEIIIDLPIK